MYTSKNNIIKRFREKINCLIPNKSGPLLIALSGGGDSLALASLLLEQKKIHNREIIAFHLDHGLRGDESLSDARFVKQWCRNKDITLKLEKAEDLAKYCSENNFSVEEGAREYRYLRLINYAKEINACAVLTGHTLDDDVETFLMRICTGASLKALSGIPEVSIRDGVHIVRPLLTFSRDELRDYLRSKKQTWREDSSNKDPNTLRNKIRLNIIPMLSREFGRDVKESIKRTLDNLKRENSFLETIIAELGIIESFWHEFKTPWKRGFCGSARMLGSFHPSLQYRIILWALNELGLPIKRRKADIFNMASQFLNLPGGKRYHNIGKNIYIARCGKAFIIAKAKRIPKDSEFDPVALKADAYIKEEKNMKNAESKKITKPGVYEVGGFEITVEKIDRTQIKCDESNIVGQVVEYFDESLMEGGFEFVSGASITDYESKPPSQKIKKDYQSLGNKTLVDNWVKWPVLKKDDELIWIVGVSRRKLYNPETSEKVIRIKASLPSSFQIFL